ncbi:hypothetical protein [Dyadobacter sp. CY343]|uniref:hypothetical protein n=1 Tax=Dyadobacter sp. CY343 TaxID=2907299 RepID=UPI001F3FE52A|nr:hypothetical protein [Dyadobacter sp. CY343]MCE7061288.1 hypothetical protein [Dyadobacter sp. CY343]
MKTSQFENTIRQKLESIEPDFQEADWAKMQKFMHAQSPPTFWQQHSSWIGYAAAASVSVVMAFLYVNQLSQNNNLVADVKNLKNQIEVIRQQPLQVPKADTVYLVQAPAATGENPEYQVGSTPNKERFSKKANQSVLAKSDAGESRKRTGGASYLAFSRRTLPAYSGEVTFENRVKNAPDDHITGANQNVAISENTIGNAAGESPVLSNINLDLAAPPANASFISNNGSVISRKMTYSLASRLSNRQIYKITQFNNAQIAKATVSDKKVEKTTKAENVVPRFNIKSPYRFGGGVQLESNGIAKTVVGEVLVGKRFSITAGISWLKVKPMEFLTDKVFKEKIRKDFRRSHPGEVPLALDVYNIKVDPTLVQIPLTVAFRNNMKDNWAYYAGAGTSVTIKSREKVSFDCVAPNREHFSKEFDKKTNTPTVGSVNFSVGIEKTWHPIVVQAEGYLYTYFTPLTPLSTSTGPGVKLKVLYQIGGKM